MPKSSTILIFSALSLLCSTYVQANDFDPSTCSFKGRVLKGKVQIVNSFPDIKVQATSSFPDIQVEIVENFPNRCGQWQIVDNFPDFKIKFVDSFPDIKVKFVKNFPGT